MDFETNCNGSHVRSPLEIESAGGVKLTCNALVLQYELALSPGGGAVHPGPLDV